MNELVFTGLIIAIAGAVLLVWGLAFRAAERYAETEGVWGYAAGDIAHAAERSRAIVGVALLVVGFLAQALNAVGIDGESAWWLLGLLLIPLAGAALRPVRLAGEKSIALARLRRNVRTRGRKDGLTQTLCDYSEALDHVGDRDRREDENSELHLTRVYGIRFYQRAVREADRASEG